jgi:hypothetical protein
MFAVLISVGPSGLLFHFGPWLKTIHQALALSMLLPVDYRPGGLPYFIGDEGGVIPPCLENIC